MQTFIKSILTLILMLSIVQPASTSVLDGAGQQLGEYATGQELLDKLNSTDATERASGMYYVLGVLDGKDFGVATKGGKPSRYPICLKPPLTVEGLAEIVKKYLQDNPSSLTDMASMRIIFALHKQWPCK